MNLKDTIKTLEKCKQSQTELDENLNNGINKFKQICLKNGLSIYQSQELINCKFPTQRETTNKGETPYAKI